MASARKALQAVMNQEGITGPKMNEALVGTANDIMKRIDYHLRRLHISPYRMNDKSHDFGERKAGTLLRSIYWQVFNATNGDEAKIKFWMESVASFVELAVQGNHRSKYGAPHPDGKRDRNAGFRSWKVANGGMPQQITGGNYKAIEVGRESKGKTLRRKAKPFISGEVRVHGRMLFDRLVETYAYLGNMIMVSAVDVRKIAMYYDPDKKGPNGSYISRMSRYSFDKNEGEYFENNLRNSDEILGDMATNRNNDIASLKSQGWEPGNSGSFKLTD